MFIKTIDKRIILVIVLVPIVIGIAALAAGSIIRNNVTASTHATPTSIVSKNKDGIPLALTYATRTGSVVRAEFCFPLPTNDDWQLGRFGQGVTLTAGDTTYPITHGGLSLAESPVNAQEAKRCAYVNFDIPEAQELGEVTITINQMMTSLPEVYDCEKAQRKLDLSNQGRGIVVNCRIGDHSSGFDVVSKPEGMTMEQAAEIAIDEGFSSTIYGPWKFATVIE